MNVKFFKVTAFVVAGVFAGIAVAQDDAATPEVPVGLHHRKLLRRT